MRPRERELSDVKVARRFRWSARSPGAALLRLAAGVTVTASLCALLPRTADAQTLIVDGPAGPALPTLTPEFTVRALGLAPADRPLVFTLFIMRTPIDDGAYIETVSFSSTDTIASTLLRRLLPSSATVYWKARAALPDGRVLESAVSGPRFVPRWLALIEPNSPLGDTFDTRRPRLVWRSARIDPAFGEWIYDIQILNNERTEQAAGGLRDTVYVPSDELQANAPYRWQVRATVSGTGENVTQRNLASFFISDPALPTTTLFYQNFPNPFPSPTSFTTCFWFDVGSKGARVSLDVVDLRGTLVKTIVPPTDFTPGKYGQGAAGSANNCDNRFVWNGTATDGRSVANGIYLARFIASGSRPVFKKIVFLGR